MARKSAARAAETRETKAVLERIAHKPAELETLMDVARDREIMTMILRIAREADPLRACHLIQQHAERSHWRELVKAAKRGANAKR